MKTAYVVLEIMEDVLHKEKTFKAISVFLSKRDADHYVAKYRLGRTLLIQETVFNPRLLN